jgi:uncharacterized damage-inducible protein DinB
MVDLGSTLSSALIKYYEEVAEKIHGRVDNLSTEALWTKPYPYGNSIGHLLLHLTGNLEDRIGARIVGTSYQRNRELEFANPHHAPKEEVLAAFDAAMNLVFSTIRLQSAEDWLVEYVAATGPPAPDRLSIFIRCLTHCNHHLGQIIYLTKEIDRLGIY